MLYALSCLNKPITVCLSGKFDLSVSEKMIICYPIEIEPEGSWCLCWLLWKRGWRTSSLGRARCYSTRGSIFRAKNCISECWSGASPHSIGYLNSPFILFVDPGHVLSRNMHEKTHADHARYFVSTGLALMIPRTSFWRGKLPSCSFRKITRMAMNLLLT